MPNKTKIAAHYVIARSKPDKLGATKLNKALWVADLLCYREYGRTVTGQETYKKLQHGPVPNGILGCLNALIEERKIVKRETPTMAGVRNEYVWIESPDISSFSAEEIDILNQAIDYVCENHTAASISALTHDALWEAIPIGQQIPVKAATIVAKKASKKQLEWARSTFDGGTIQV